MIRDAFERAVPNLDMSPMLLFARVGVLTRRYAEFNEQHLMDTGLTHADYQTLGLLRSGIAQAPTTLAALVRQTTAGMTKTLDRLEKASLIERKAHPSDGRRVEITLTKRGTQLIDKTLTKITDAQRAIYESFDDARRQEVTDVLDDLLDNFVSKPI